MNHDLLVERLFDCLVNGDRPQARALLTQAEKDLGSASEMLSCIAWPAHELVDKLFRADQLTVIGYQMATRLLRALIDQAAARLPHQPRNNRRVFAVCGSCQGEEMCCQMAVDALEAAGFTVRFAGGGIPHDEVLATVHETQPDILLLFGSSASDLPGIRIIVDSMREIKGSPNTRIVVGGGVFNRAEGLDDELNVDMSATSPQELVEKLIANPSAREQRRVEPKVTVRRRRAA